MLRTGIVMTQDEEHLRLLSIFHYIVGGLSGLFALIPIAYLVFGLIFLYSPEKFANREVMPPAFFGWIFVIFGAFCTLAGMLVSAMIITAGRFLSKRINHLFCLIIAGLQCAIFPFGTALGVFTIIVLMREPVKQLFMAKP
jgi:hypothetical protein